MAKQIYAWVTLIGLVSIQAFPLALETGQDVSASSSSGLVAQVNQRIETNRFQVRVYQGKQLVQLAHFTELFVVTPLTGRSQTIESLVGRSVAIVRSAKQRDLWEVYALNSVAVFGRQGHLVGGFYEPAQEHVPTRIYQDPLTLPENIFKIKQVFVSSRQHPVEIKLDGRIIYLKSGDALVVL
jgi:hypothetical protein